MIVHVPSTPLPEVSERRYRELIEKFGGRSTSKTGQPSSQSASRGASATSHFREGRTVPPCFNDQLHRIADADAAPWLDAGVEREPATKAPNDIAQHLGVYPQCVRIHGRHVTAPAPGI
jgi:hypothetical protein